MDEAPIHFAEPWLDQDCASAVSAQVLSSFVGPGPASREFARAIEEFLAIQRCVLTTSGTVALSVAAVAVGLQPGDEVLVPAYGVISTINAFAVLGLKPKLVDIDRQTACIDAAQIEKRISERTKAICFVNFAGYTGESLLRVARLAADRGLPLIEDAACAFGHRYDSKAAGTFGTVGTLSFSVPKILTTGQGGAVVVNSQEVADRALAYTDHGDTKWRETNLNHGIGSNLRFNDVLAALAMAQMRTIEERLRRKRMAYLRLRSILSGHLYSVPGDQAPLHNVIFSKDRERIIASLRERKIAAVIQYRSIYQHPAYAHLNDAPFPNADYWTDHALYLPFGLSLSEEDASRVARATTESGAELLEAPR